ncbi:MAG: hypothetical protein MUE88_03970 [Flavobacteriales bacterium]|nr:hypothetical protein [Flavobacteriales bacterium]
MRVPLIMRFIFGLVIVVLAPGVSAAVRAVHVTGIVANIQSWEIRGFYTAMVVAHTEPRRYGVVPTRPQLMVDQRTGRFEGDLMCEVIRNEHGRWVDIHLINMAPTFQGYSTMVIRAPYARTIDLGTFEWQATRYRWKEDSMVIDTGVPRDTVIGDLFGDHVRISPINPEPDDSMRFEFVWNNSGQPHVAALGGFHMKDCCTTLCDLTFAVRTDTDVFTESWPHHVVLHLQAEVKGRYRLRQVPAQDEHLRDVDFLLNKDLYFTVGHRLEL